MSVRGGFRTVPAMPRGVFVALAVCAIVLSVVAFVAPAMPAGSATGGSVVDIDYASDGGTEGLYITHSEGTVEARDGLPHFGDRPVLDPGETVIALSVRPAIDGYWLFTTRGRAIGFGGAQHFGDASALPLAAPMISAEVCHEIRPCFGRPSGGLAGSKYKQ